MGTLSVNRLGALALIVGPVLAVVFFLLEPGALLVDRADSSDAIASITALASNAALAHLVAFVVPLGLILALYGLYVLQTGVRDGGSGDALSRLGLLFITIASIGWVLTYGLTHVMANAPAQAAQALQAMVPVFSIESGITNVSSLSAALGVVLFGLGLSTREDVNKIAAFAVVVVAIVALVCLVISSNADVRNVMTTIARVCYLAWAIWFVSLGVGLLKKA